MSKKLKLIGNIFLIAGSAVILAGIILFAINRYEDNNAANLSHTLTDAAKEMITHDTDDPDSGDLTVPEPDGGSPDAGTTSDLKVVGVNGYPCCGILTVPKIELEMVVFDTWNNDYLKKSLCRYQGSVNTDDLIIAGHNYKSSFGKLKKLTVGDVLYFTDMDGTTIEYVVKDIEVVGGTEISRMISGDWDLTLYTCTYGGRDRLTVRCDRNNG